MACSARVLLFDPDERYPDLATTLENSGYESLVSHRVDQATNLVREASPDIGVLASGGGDMCASIRALARAREDSVFPLIVIGSDLNDVTGTAEGTTEVLSEPFSEAELLGRLGSLTRLATMQTELVRRTATARRYGVQGQEEIAPEIDLNDAQILIVADPSIPISEVHARLGRSAVLATVEDPFAALPRLEGGNFDAVLIFMTRAEPEVLELCRRLRQNTRLYNLPALVVAEEVSSGDVDDTVAAGATEILSVKQTAEDIVARTLSLVAQQRYRLAMQQIYRDARHYATSDSLTGLYNRGFQLSHLSEQIVDAGRWNKALSVGYFEVANLAELNDQLGYAAGDQVLRQVGGLIGALVRGEDLPARFRGDGFSVALPNSDDPSARRVLKRIAGVINNTTFTVPDHFEPVSVDLLTGCATFQNDISADALLARARASLTD